MLTNASDDVARAEVNLSIERLFTYAAWADKWDGNVHHTPYRNVTLAMPEPIGVFGVVCPDEAPLLAFVSAIAPAIALGNTVVAVPSERWPLMATDLYQLRYFRCTWQASSTLRPASVPSLRKCWLRMMTWTACGTSLRTTAVLLLNDCLPPI